MTNRIKQLAGHEGEEGFTLIELMVVVLIIGILMAIAIPTFLGAKNTANARAAQSNLRNAVTAETTFYTGGSQQYGFTTDLATLEPALTFNDATGITIAPLKAGNNVYIYMLNATGGLSTSKTNNVILGALGADGNAYYINDNNGAVIYETVKPAGQLTPPSLTASPNSINTWASQW